MYKLFFSAALMLFASFPVLAQPVLTVDQETGAATLENPEDASVQFDGYEIRSAGGLIEPGNWTSLSDQFFTGWVEVPTSSATGIAELNPQSSLALPAQTVGAIAPSIGGIYAGNNSSAVASAMSNAGFGNEFRDLQFSYSVPGAGSVVEGIVNYVGQRRFNNLVLNVDTGTGGVQLVNESPLSVEIDFIELRSAGASLDASWNGLGDTNTGWQMAGTNSSTGLAEFNPAGSLVVAGGGAFDLGTAFSVGAPEDLSFSFHRVTDPTGFAGEVRYVTNVGSGGDFDGDGDYDCDDIDSLVADIAQGNDTASFDLTGDGNVDTDDLTAWLSEAGNENIGAGRAYLVGDANLDGSVDVSDFNLWNSNKFSLLPAWCSGDFTADGSIDVSDFNSWNSNKFNSSDIASVPEPSGAFLSMFILLGLLVRRNRRA